MSNLRSLFCGTGFAAALALLAVLAAAPGAAAQASYGTAGTGESQVGYDSGYSYVRNLRGSATLIEGDTGDRVATEVNQPVLSGDRLWVAPGSMAEVLLSDGNLLRIDGDSEIHFARLAASPETRDEVTELVLVTGNVQLVVFADAAGSELPRVELPQGTVYVSEAGSYRLTAGRGWSQVLARSGWAEVATDRGSVVVRGGEEALFEGSRGARGDVRTASYRDDLERWGERLDRQVADTRYVDRSLRHAAASLDGYGSWIDDGGRHVWRPRVGSDWHPYWHGRWRHTPLGLTWVSSEPWGWAPYHYGTWNLHPRHGWVWYPGTAFAPAWVYWYWGPSHVAWVPVGYYTHHYRSRYHSPGFRFGVYGWAGGHWGMFSDWVFCPTGYLGWSSYPSRRYWRGRDWNRHGGGGHVPRGIIAVDTRPLGPDDWRDGDAAIRALRSRPTTTGGGELPDVTSFIARERELPADVTRRVFADPGDGVAVRVAGTPLAPDAASAARPRAALPRSDGGVVPGGVGAADGGTAVRSRVSPRAGDESAPTGARVGTGSDTPTGVRAVRPRQEPAAGGDGAAGGDRPTTGVRTRTVQPRDDDSGASAAPARPATPTAPTVRPRRIEPRDPGGAGVSASPRNVGPGEPAGTAVRPRTVAPPRATGSGSPSSDAAPRRIEPTSPPRSGPDSPRGSVRPRAIEPRDPAGDPARPAAPTVRRPSEGSGSGTAATPRRVAPGSLTPDAYARSPRATPPSTDRPTVVAPPRSDRRSVESTPPARRVVTGVRSEAPPRSSRPAPPPAARPSTPQRAPAASSPPPSTTSSDKRSGAVRSRGGGTSSPKASSSSASGSSSSNSGGRARATRRDGDDN